MEERLMARILVAEDDELTRFLLKVSLEQNGHEVTAVSNGREALQSAMFEKPDLLVLDLMMPGVNGTEVIRQLRDDINFSGTKIVVVTGLHNAEEIPESQQVDVLLKKPISIESLLQEIKSILV